jgi:DNA-binding SARP family transcriptional activator/Tfp pilus assembly protein PilF
VAYLRRVFGDPGVIVARPPGYFVDGSRVGTDVIDAERLIRDGQRDDDPVRAAQLLEAALALWRGRPMTELAGLRWFDEQVRRLDQLLLRARRALVDARLVAGEHEELLPDLVDMCAEQPFDEQLHAQLMRALYRSGRQADALETYRRLRRVLRDEVGVEPGEPLNDLHAAILRHDPAVAAPAAPSGGPATAMVPAQLPMAVATFTGRRRELDILDTLVRARDKSTVAISALSGMAGVGKTALGLYWAHRVANRFPDGQLYVNLRGFDPSGVVVDPAEALSGFLNALGVAADRVPAELPAQAALYRSLLAGKRMLILLDNARTVAQVRPLLPGAPGCLVLVTSRDQLGPLVAIDGAYPLNVALLSPVEARELLDRRLGRDRTSAEPAATDEIVTQCAGLPLALAIAAARAATRPALPLARLADELGAGESGLDAFVGADPAADVRAVFSWSYRALSDGAARLFRLLSLHPGPDIGGPAAASLCALTRRQAAPLLRELVEASLLTEHVPDRYSFHDLLRVFAAELSAGEDREPDRMAATRRILDHYLQTAYAGAALLSANRGAIALAEAAPGTDPEELSGHDDAMDWFTAELPGLTATVRHAAQTGFHRHTWQLAWAMSVVLLRQGRWNDHETLLTIAVDAAERLGDRAARAQATHCLGLGYARAGRFDDAEPVLRRALDLFEQVGDRVNQARVHSALVWSAETRGDLPAALRLAQQGLALYQSAGHATGHAEALGDVGWIHALIGDYAEALTCCEQALVMHHQLGHREAEAATWDSLGYIHRRIGDHRRAVTDYQRAIEIHADLGDRYNRAVATESLGDVHHDAGDSEAADRTWRAALAILDHIGHPDADQIRAKLTSMGPRAR